MPEDEELLNELHRETLDSGHLPGNPECPFYAISPECALAILDNAEAFRAVIAKAQAFRGTFSGVILLDTVYMGEGRPGIDLMVRDDGDLVFCESTTRKARLDDIKARLASHGWLPR